MDHGCHSESVSTYEPVSVDSVAPYKGTGMLRVDALRSFCELVTQLGGDANALLAKFEIDPGLLANRHAVIAHRAFVLLLERAAAVLNCPDFGLRLAAVQDSGKVFGPLEVVMRNSFTLYEAFRYCAEHFQAYSTAMQMGVEEDAAKASTFLRFEFRIAKLPFHPQTMEHALLLMQRNALGFSGGQVRAYEIWLRHEPLSPLAAYQSYFGATVRFAQSMNGLWFHRPDLDVPIPECDPQLHELATHFIERRFPSTEPVLSTRVRTIIEHALPAGDCTYGAVATMLGMHARALQRGLRAEGESFESIKDSVRRDIALRCLQQPAIPLIRVAEMLGYSATSMLSRSCYRWFSASPRQLRGRAAEERPRKDPPLQRSCRVSQN